MIKIIIITICVIVVSGILARLSVAEGGGMDE